MDTKLRAWRRKVGLKQTQVALKAKITARNYQRIEQGIQDPKTSTAILIADTLGIKTFKDFKELFGAATSDKGIESDCNPNT